MASNFEVLGISEPILKALEEMGFESPTEVQGKAIPPILEKKDLIVMSKTGSGKTAVFGIPMLQLIDGEAPGPQGLILTPTRELAVQVDSDLKQMGKHLSIKTTAVYGQHSVNVEVQALQKGVSIVTGTPGRVFDHIQHGKLITKHVRFLVLDEADRMLDMGFIDQVMKIIKTIPKDRVTLLFSATIPPEIKRICQSYMKNPEMIEIASPTKTVDTIRQLYYRVEHNEKRASLNRLLLLERPETCMIFCNTRIAVDQVQNFLLRKGYASAALHGDIPQGKRLKTIQQFKQGELFLLIATDVAARGIHIDDLSLVINYDVPNERDSYIHRIGRTGRAGNDGRAITLVTSEDIMSLYEIEEHIGAMIEEGEMPGESALQEHKEAVEQWVEANREKSKLIVPDEPQTREQGGERRSRRSKASSGGRQTGERSGRSRSGQTGEGATQGAQAASGDGPAQSRQARSGERPVQSKPAQSGERTGAFRSTHQGDSRRRPDQGASGRNASSEGSNTRHAPDTQRPAGNRQRSANPNQQIPHADRTSGPENTSGGSSANKPGSVKQRPSDSSRPVSDSRRPGSGNTAAGADTQQKPVGRVSRTIVIGGPKEQPPVAAQSAREAAPIQETPGKKSLLKKVVDGLFGKRKQS